MTSDDPTPAPKKRSPWLRCGGCFLVPVLLLVALLVAGGFLPDEYHGHVVLRIEASPDEVWTALEDHHRTPVTGSMHEATTDLPPEDGLAVWEEDMGESTVTVRTVARSPGKRLVRELADSEVPMTATMELTLEAAEDGVTRVVGANRIVLEDGTWHVPVFRVLLSLTGGADESLREYLRAVAEAVGAPAELE